MIARAPFAVQSIQVDGGSEFMAEFEEAGASQGIPLYVLPPDSPQLSGGVKRSNIGSSGRSSMPGGRFWQILEVP